MNNLFFLLLSFVLTFACCHSAVENTSANNSDTGKHTQPDQPTGPDGSLLFRKNCVTCHGADGKLGLNGAKDLSISTLPLDSRIHLITHGKNLMTPFKALLSEAEIKAVAEYSLTLKER